MVFGLCRDQGADRKRSAKHHRDGYDCGLKIITEKNVEFERLAQGLLEYETLTGEEIQRRHGGEPPHSDEDEDDSRMDKPSVTAIPKAKAQEIRPR